MNKVYSYSVGLLLYYLATLIPKKKNLWLFSAWGGMRYNDNPKYLFDYVTSRLPEVEAYWLTKSKILHVEMRQSGYNVIYANSLKGKWLQARARVVFFSHSLIYDYDSEFIGANTKCIQLWHGLPIKRVMYDMPHIDKEKILKRQRLKKIFSPHLASRIDLFTCSSNYDLEIYQSAFNLPKHKMKVTGLPRYDFIKDSHSPLSYDKNVFVYAPTLRGETGSIFQLFPDKTFLELLDKTLTENSTQLIIKLHPVQSVTNSDLTLLRQFKSIKLEDASADVDRLINAADLLIIDYSSIYFDLLLINKPFILAPIDLDTYLKDDRGFCVPYDDFSFGNIAYDWSDILNYMVYFLKNGDQFESHRKLKAKKFHEFTDKNACKRIINEVTQLLG